jgi:predicted GNAT family acetyltransferase
VVSRDGKVILAASMTPPFGLLVVPLSEDARLGLPLLVEGLIREGMDPPDVHAVQPYGRQFAEVWAARTGGSFELEMAQRIYTLVQVIHPQGVSGEFVQAGSEHTDLVTAWFQEFEAEALQADPTSSERLRKSVSGRIAAGDWFLWQDGGEVVSMCLRTRPTRGGCSIAGVYTPPDKRGKGYASACVAALSQRLLDEGFSFTSLFTDLANPTSNQIYMNIGYQPLADFDKYMLVR